MTAQRFPVWATLILFFSFIILCSLGTWQIKRLHWKEGLLAEIDQAYQVDADKNLISSAALLDAYHENRLVLRGTVIGKYLGNKTFKLGPRPHDGRQGYHLYTPLKMLDGGIILINRGWISTDAKLPPVPEGSALRIKGLLRKPDPANDFTPLNRPADDEWFHIDFAELAKVKALPNLAPYVLYVEGPVSGAEPVPVGAKPELYNNHKAYAVFWFMLAGLMVIIYTIRFREQLFRK
jgi:surfeit locus 1 family protein